MTAMMAASSIKIPQVDNENNQAETWEFRLFTRRKEKKNSMQAKCGPSVQLKLNTMTVDPN